MLHVDKPIARSGSVPVAPAPAAPASPAPAPVLPYLAALGAILCWASLAAALYRSLGALHPQQILAYGMGIAGIALLAWDWGRGRPPWRTWPGARGMLLGLYGIFGYHALLVGAFALAPAVQANILNYTWPLWIIVLGTWSAGQRLTGRIAWGGVLGLIGAAIAVEPWQAAGAHSPATPAGLWGTGPSATVWLGFGLALAAGCCWGSFTVLLRRSGDANRSAMGWWCLQAAAVSALWMWAADIPFAIAPDRLRVLVYIGLVPLGAAFPLWELATRQCALNVLGLLSYLTPPLSTLLLGWAAGRAATGWAWTGLAVVLAGAALGSTRRLSPAKPAALKFEDP